VAFFVAQKFSNDIDPEELGRKSQNKCYESDESDEP